MGLHLPSASNVPATPSGPVRALAAVGGALEHSLRAGHPLER